MERGRECSGNRSSLLLSCQASFFSLLGRVQREELDEEGHFFLGGGVGGNRLSGRG